VGYVPQRDGFDEGSQTEVSCAPQNAFGASHDEIDGFVGEGVVSKSDAIELGEYELAPPAGAGLSNVAATLLLLMGYEPPAEYHPPLIKMK